MVISGFSKVADYVDEEEESLERAWAEATLQFAEAQAAYSEKTRTGNADATERAIKMFEDAEAWIEPFLRSGLAGLNVQNLSMVLKGRLHRAVMLAQLPSLQPDDWRKVKSLVETVLEYDMQNIFAIYLRGLALKLGEGRIAQGDEIINNAFKQATERGMTELITWHQSWLHPEQKELEAAAASEAASEPGEPAEAKEPLEEPLFVDPPAAKVAAKEPLEEPLSVDPLAVKVAAKEPFGEPPLVDSPAAKIAAPVAKALQRGFLTRRKAKATQEAEPERPPAKAEQERPPADPPADHSLPLQEAQRQLQDAQQQLQEAQRQLQEETGRRREAESLTDKKTRAAEMRLEEWQHELCEVLDSLGAEFEESVLEGGDESASDDSQDAVEGLLASVGKLTEQVEASRKWSEGEHQRYMDVSTEVATVREMTAKELRERQEASRQQVSDMRELTSRVGELKAAARALREQAVKQATAEERHAEAEKDIHQLANRVAEFHALPTGVKVAAMVDDATTFKMMLLAFLLGLLLMLGVATEFFGPRRCGLVCSPPG